MPRQRGPIRLSGTIEDITFYKTIYGSLARSKSSLDKKRVLTDPSFANSRGASRDFSTASKASSEIRTALRICGHRCKDHATHHRMNSAMLEVVKSDNEHLKGARQAGSGNLRLIRGFEWNTSYVLTNVFKVGYRATIDASTGKMNVSINEFDPTNSLLPAKGATHFKIKAIGASLDFEKKKHESAQAETEFLPMEGIVNAQELSFEVPAGKQMVLALSVQFYVLTAGFHQELYENCCMRIVEVS